MHLPLASHHSITSSASNWIELGTTGLPARSRASWAGGGDKAQSPLRRNYLTGRDGDRINAVLAAAGYNFSLLRRWFEELLRILSLILCHALLAAPLHLTRCRKTFFTADEGQQHHLVGAAKPLVLSAAAL